MSQTGIKMMSEIDAQEKVLREISYSMFQYQPLNKYLIDGFNEFLQTGLKKVVENSSFTTDILNQQYRFQFSLEGTYTKPEIEKTSDKSMASGFPNYYRTHKEEYCFGVKIKIELFDKNDLKLKTTYFDGKIPIMLGSDACNSLLETDREKINECEKDPYGYFIMGFEKALIAQEKTASNFSYNVVQDKKISCEMLSQNNLGFISKVTIFEKAKKERKANIVCATLTRLNSKKSFLTVVDMLHLSYKVFPGQSQYNNGSLEDYFDYFDVTNTDNNAYKQALCDFIGYIYFFTAGTEEGKDFIPLALENYIAQTINYSTSNTEALNTLVSKVYEETIAGSTAPTDADEDEGDEQEEVEDEDDMIMDVEEEETIDVAVDEEWKKWKKTMEKFFFPHISNPVYKRLVFMNMVVKFMLCSKGLKDIDNRDDFSVKKVETPGMLVQNLFAKSIQGIKKKILQKIDADYKKAEKKAREEYEKKQSEFDLTKYFNIGAIDVTVGQKSFSDNGLITDIFKNSFTRDTWGDARTGKKGVTQQVSRFNLPSIYASIRRLSAHSNRQNKIVKPRMIDPSQFMLVAPEETPDNDRIGLMKHFSVSTYVTYEFPEELVKNFYNQIMQELHYLQSGKRFDDLNSIPVYKNDKDVSTQTLVMFNGEPVGFTNKPELLRNKLIQIRRQELENENYIYRFVSIVLQDESMGPNRVMKYLKINVTAGRLIAPFFVVNEKTGKLVIDELKYNNQTIREFLNSIPVSYLETFMRRRKRNREERKFIEKHPMLDNLFEYLMRMGCVEYLDAHEIQFSNIALNLQQLYNDKSMTFSHMLLNPEFMFGVTAALMTFIGHNPTPRISLYVNHIKQAVSFQSEQFLKRMEPHKDKQKIANYSHRRQIGTYMDEIIGTDDLTIYQKATVCIYPFMGQTQEDAIMVKKSAIEKGLFSSTIYQTYTIENPKQVIADLPDEKKVKFEEGVIREKMAEEKGAKQAMFKFNEIVQVVKNYYKRFKKLPDEKIALKLDDLSEELHNVTKPNFYQAITEMIPNLTMEELNWRDEKTELYKKCVEKYNNIKLMVNAIYLANKNNKFAEQLKSYDERVKALSNIYNMISNSKPSRDIFPTNEVSSIDKKREQIQSYIDKLDKLESNLNDFLDEEGLTFYVANKTPLSQFKQEFNEFIDIFDWLLMNKKINQNSYANLRKQSLGKDGIVSEFYNEALQVMDERDVYDKLMMLIDNYNKVSENPELFGKNENFMDYTKTRSELEQFCKEHDCYDLLNVVEYKSKRAIYQEPTKVEMDDVLGFVKKDEGEKKILFEGEKGIVDKIQKNPTRGVYRVRIRDFHIAQVGDKIAGPYAQKGVIAAIVPDEDLPFIKNTGEVPDVFVNPLAFPSRLTIGMFLEAFLGKVISKVETRRIKDTSMDKDLNFYIPAYRTGVPVFNVFKSFIQDNYAQEWAKILGLRKDFTTMVDDDFVKTTKAMESTSAEIKKLFKPIYNNFLKLDLTYDDLDENDKSFFDMIFNKQKFSLDKLAVTFGSIGDHRSELSKLDTKYATELKSFYRNYFSTDFISLEDMLLDEREKIVNNLASLKDYGRAFKTYDVKEAQNLVKQITDDLGMGDITEKEYMVNGQSGQMIGESRYVFNSTKAMQTAVKEILTKDYETIDNDDEYRMYMKWFYLALPELILAHDESIGEDQEYLKALRIKLESVNEQGLIDRAKHTSRKILIPVFNENDELLNFIPNHNLIRSIVDNMDPSYYNRMAEKMKIIDKQGVLDEKIANKLKTTDLVTIKTVPVPLTVGVVPYLILKHYVHDKIQERDDGPIDIVTRQSTKGKKNGGGNRFGEMEANAVVAHGVPYFLQERLNRVVDNTRMNICQDCGQICSHNAKGQPQCAICKSDSNLVSVMAPFSLKMFADFNTAMGIKNFIYTKVIGKDEQF